MINIQSLASAEISDITRPRSAGKMVDTRVVRAQKEPRPDYDKMRRIVHGTLVDEGEIDVADPRERKD